MSNSIYITGYDSRLRELPEGYIQVEYIESNGTQYIDTGFTPNNLSACEVILSCTSISDAANGCFGAAGANYTTDAFEFYYNGTVHNLGFGDTPFRYTSTISINDILTVRISQEERTVLLNNVQLCSDVPTEETFTCPTTFITHALNRAGTIQYYSSTRLYSCKLWDNGILVRDLIPCINANNEVGLYDLVSKTFYDNNGTGTFIAGDIISTSLVSKKIQNNYVSLPKLPENYTALEYIESSGTQYINTGLSMPNGFHAVFDATVTKLTSAYQGFFGTLGSTSPYYRNYFALNDKNNWNVGCYGYRIYTGPIVNQKYSYDVCNIHNSIFLKVNGIEQTASSSGEDTVSAERYSGNIWIFARNYATAPGYSNIKLYNLKFYETANYNNLIANYIPCINSNNEIGLYDLVSETFYGNSGTGTFIAGPEVENTVVTKKIKKGYMVTKNAELTQLPEGYTQLQYIESADTQYLDTGFYANQDTRLVMDCDILTMYNGTPDTGALFGGRTGYKKTAFCVWCGTDNWQTDYGNTILTFEHATLGRHKIDKNKNLLTIDGETYTNTAATFQCTSSILLFALQNDGVYDDRRHQIRLHSCKIYDNGNLVRDYRPCTNVNGIAGLYDIINDTFTGSAVDTQFISGPIAYEKCTSLIYTE